MPPQSFVPFERNEALVKQKMESIDKIELQYKSLQNTYHTLWGRTAIPIRWPLVVWTITCHIYSLYTLYNFTSLKIWTIIWGIFLIAVGIFGTTAGAHRLWSHKAYKANLPLKILLAMCHVMSADQSTYRWVRDHRLHHKYTDTDADPQNTKRGFFFAHIGWYLSKKHPDVLRAGLKMDMSDILEDPVIGFFHKYFLLFHIILVILVSIGVPVYFWGESLFWSFNANAIRIIICGHIILATNSIAHYVGTKPYNKNSTAVDSPIFAWFIMGEGWHNYHHAFPWDYRTDEIGRYFTNGTTALLDFFGKIGWAYDFRLATPQSIKSFTMKYGDGSHPVYGQNYNCEEEFNKNVNG